MEVAKLAAPPNLEVRFVSCNESAIKRWLSSELEETVFSLTHELFMSKHHTVTLNEHHFCYVQVLIFVKFRQHYRFQMNIIKETVSIKCSSSSLHGVQLISLRLGYSIHS